MFGSLTNKYLIINHPDGRREVRYVQPRVREWIPVEELTRSEAKYETPGKKAPLTKVLALKRNDSGSQPLG